MPKWEYIAINARMDIVCETAKANDLVNAIKSSFPNSEINVKDGYIIETNLKIMELINFLGCEGWELVVGVGEVGKSNLYLKRPA